MLTGYAQFLLTIIPDYYLRIILISPMSSVIVKYIQQIVNLLSDSHIATILCLTTCYLACNLKNQQDLFNDQFESMFGFLHVNE